MEAKLNLKVCLYGGKESNVETSFDANITIEDLERRARQLFNVNTDSETKLWVNNQIYTFKPNEANPSSNSNDSETSASKAENNVQASTSLTKQPPSSPPMPTNNHTESNSSSNSSTPTVITRQAANSLSKPIALPDTTNKQPTGFPDILVSNHDSATNQSQVGPQNSTKQTLADASVPDGAIITLEVMNADGTWPSTRPRYVATRSSKAQPGLCGLSNMGNTCFMNAALQCLSNTTPLTNFILTDKYVDDINTTNPLGMQGEIARTYAELIKVMWSGNHTSFLPREFRCAVSRFAPQFNGFAQQDCQELMAFLLDGLHEDLNRIKNKPYIEIKTDVESRPDEVVAEESWSNYKKRNDSAVVDTFHAMLKSTLVCPGCELVSVTFDPFCYLSLPLPVKREKQVGCIFMPAPKSISKTLLADLSKRLTKQQFETIQQYGSSISSFDGVIEENAGYLCPDNCPKSCKLQVPRSGPASEICHIVARVINEERSSSEEKVKPDNLVVCEVSFQDVHLRSGVYDTDDDRLSLVRSVSRITKVYESNEHYNQIGDDIVVVEKKSDYVIPLYIRAQESKTVKVSGKPVFLHVPNLKFETLYLSALASMSNLTKLSDDCWYEIDLPSEQSLQIPNKSITPVQSDAMDCDLEDAGENNANEAKAAVNHSEPDRLVLQDNGNANKIVDDLPTNGNGDHTDSNGNERKPTSAPIQLSIVNSLGGLTVEILDSNKSCDYNSKLYLGATLSFTTTELAQFKHLSQDRTQKSESIETFTPKVCPKPTLQLKDCITQFTNLERLGADDPWYCPKCKKHQQATKKFDIWSLPKVLIIHLKRFSFSRSWRDKIDTLVKFPVENLDMSKYVLNPEQRSKKSLMYNLIGVANHFGGLGGGHYTAFAKNSVLNGWYSFDDAIVTPTSASNVVTRSAYVLFYQLDETDQ